MDQTLKVKIYNSIKKVLQPYAAQLEIRGQKENQYHLYGQKEVHLKHKIEQGMYFASIQMNKGFVGFYFFPIYTHPLQFQDLDDKLMKCLKGKSCFHIKQDDHDIYRAIGNALERGFKFYREIDYL